MKIATTVGLFGKSSLWRSHERIASSSSRNNTPRPGGAANPSECSEFLLLPSNTGDFANELTRIAGFKPQNRRCPPPQALTHRAKKSRCCQVTRGVGKTENIKRLPDGFKSLQELRRTLFVEFGPDCVITDFEPMTAYLANHYSLPLVTLDNQQKPAMSSES